MSPDRVWEFPAPPDDNARVPAGPGVVRSERDAAWIGTQQPVQMQAPPFSWTIYGDIDGVITRGILRFGPFDLYPGLLDLPGPSRPAIPIYREGAILTVQLWRTEAFGPDMEVSSIEIGHVADPHQIVMLSTNTWITGDFYEIASAQRSVTLAWAPPATLRYWGVIVVFDQVEGAGREGAPFRSTPLLSQGSMI